MKDYPPPSKKKKKKKKKVLDHYLHHDLGMLLLLWWFFAHLLILQYPDHHQNLISSSLYHSGPAHKISSQSVYNVLSYVVHRQTNRQTNQRYQKHNLLCQGGNYLKDNYVLTDLQSGFQPGRSTTTQLVKVYHEFCKAVESEKEISVYIVFFG